MQNLIVAVLILCAVLYFGRRIYQNLHKGGGCGCGCSNCTSKKDSRK
ncbi:MAG: FeoB-associated Cys-rich membrane protein [Desulfovibrionaceae bacterium]|nr:FeoB-associated Cys-rich membrane protein [Desulfovibrionaceae bacterium]